MLDKLNLGCGPNAPANWLNVDGGNLRASRARAPLSCGRVKTSCRVQEGSKARRSDTAVGLRFAFDDDRIFGKEEWQQFFV
jgi:hypothetical protein